MEWYEKLPSLFSSRISDLDPCVAHHTLLLTSKQRICRKSRPQKVRGIPRAAFSRLTRPACCKTALTPGWESPASRRYSSRSTQFSTVGKFPEWVLAGQSGTIKNSNPAQVYAIAMVKRKRETGESVPLGFWRADHQSRLEEWNWARTVVHRFRRERGIGGAARR
jgi:hypothetical protein